MLKHIGTNTIETERLALRRFCVDDMDNVFQNWAGDFDVQSGYGEPVCNTEKEASDLLEKYINAYEKPETYRWVIDLKSGEKCVGQVAYFLVDSKNEFCEIEYCIGKDFQNRGYISEAVKAITAFGFQEVNFNRIQVSCRSVNTPSKRVIEKCGFTYEGCLRQFFNHLGEFQDRLYYSILKNEYQRENK